MKVCPHCQKTYIDDTLNFCLDDGTVLTKDNSSLVEQPETLVMNNPQRTEVNHPFETQQNQPTPQTWQNSPKYQTNSSGGSKSWIWVLGILFGIAILCGGGILGLLVIDEFVPDEEQPKESVTIKKGPITKTSTLDENDKRKVVKTSDFSDWQFDSDKSITANNSGNKLELTTTDGYYYVFVFKEFPTYDSSIKLTVINKTGKKTKYGYGLVVNSHPTSVLLKDYAFLIDSNTGQYRIVKHVNKDEFDVVSWTNSSKINKGSKPNDIEVRIFGKTMKFYINGEYITSEDDSTGYKNGVAGVYTSDAVPITYTNIELKK